MRYLAIALSLASACACAQHTGHGSYAGQQTRDIKALSPEQVADLREGRGMGASLPAELNGVPGPLHVLQLSEPLKVTEQQRAALEAVSAEMKTAAQRLGHEVIAAERDLDRSFKAGSLDEQAIRDKSNRIAALNGELRAVHLVAHLKTRQLLSDAQVAAYNVERGYSVTADQPEAAGHRH